MDTNPFAPAFEILPHDLPIFPLTGVLLMPHGQLPLNIFEPRYKAMIEDAMGGARMIGMVQPKSYGSEEIYQTGCAGKIIEFSETDDGRYLITLAGICRFHMDEELEILHGYRRIRPNWSKFQDDLEVKQSLGVDREKLLGLLDMYFEREGMSCDFDKFDVIQDGQLMTCLSMICPFEPPEKQALLEQICCKQRAQMFMTMLEIAIKSGKPLDKAQAQCH